MNSTKYVQYLRDYLLPYAQEHFGTDYVFQQDNSSVHSSNETNHFFQEEHISVLDWPSQSPNLNPIENLCGILLTKVYENGRQQFYSKKDLKKALQKYWDEIPLQVLHNLSNSKPV